MIIHAGLFVRSLQSSTEFYCEKLGFSVVATARVEGPMVQFLTNHCYDALRMALVKVSDIGAKIELMEVEQDSRLQHAEFAPAAHAGAIAMLVPDLNLFVEDRKRLGIYPAVDVFRVSLTQNVDTVGVLYRDPDEHLLEFLQICE